MSYWSRVHCNNCGHKMMYCDCKIEYCKCNWSSPSQYHKNCINDGCGKRIKDTYEKLDEARGQRDIYKEALESVFEKIEHGDQEHRDWLKGEMDTIIAEAIEQANKVIK